MMFGTSPRPEGKSIVTSKWIFKINHAVDGSIEKYKERFVAHAFSQREGVDYDETFAPVARFTSICTIIALASAMRWRYLRGTIGYGLRYSVDSDMQLVGYTDSDWAGSVQDQKSTSGCCFSLGSAIIS